MVLHKRFNYGYNGCQAPFVPRRPRSARGKRSSRKRIMETQMCAFDLLATVAGNLLLEENSPTPVNIAARDCSPSLPKVTVKEEQQDEGGASKVGPCDQESCHEGARPAEHVLQRQMPLFALKTHSQASSSAGLSPESISIKLDPSEEVASAEESVYNRNRVGSGRILGTKSPVLAGIHQPKVEEGIPSPFQFRGQKPKGGFSGHISDPCCSELPMKVDFKPPLWSSESSIEVPVDGDSRTPHSSSFLKSRHDMKRFTVDRYDEDISSACNLPRCVPTKSSRAQRFGDRRIRKLLASKFWKVGPTVLKAKEFSHKDEEVKPFFRSKKMCYTRHRTQGCSFKRRKLFERGLASTCEGTIISEGNKRGLCCSAEKASAVKLSIESFKVPELFVELPETATIGCLKRTVVEAVTAVLCGGFRIGVVLQGKKLRDDSKTLLQAGISLDDRLDDLGFTLEPKPSQASSNLTANTEDSHFLSGCSDSEPPRRRLSAAPASDTVMLDVCTHPPPPPPPAASENCVENNHHDSSAPAPAGTVPAEKSTSDSKALVVVPPMEVEALAVVPFHRKPRCAEATPRRVRRPFSVSEVEALVQAVEMLGTGRWRDVKLRAFENAKHRTYVDLKDKWKTLVHTAKISPQQRRGEPVPQELLDRVLSANAYWSQHHAKLQVKQPPSSEQLLLA